MYLRAFITLFIALLLSAASHVSAQESATATASVSGRVTVGGKAVPGVTLLLQTSEPEAARTIVAKAVSGVDGRFSINGIAAGRYQVVPVTPAFIAPTEEGYGSPGKALALAQGQAVEGFDFALTRGGVITGQVTDAEGKPVVGERIRLVEVTETEDMSQVTVYTPSMLETDDRGVYRIYGLPSGRYLVSVGESAQSGAIRMGGRRGFYTRTFHPGVTDEFKARTVVVTAGSEVTNVDIRLGRLVQTYDAVGRIVGARDGLPVPGTTFAYVAVKDNGMLSDILGYGSRSDARGEFRIVNLLPGSYAAFVTSDGESGFYSDPIYFDVLNEDVAGLEIKLLQGSSVSGTVIVEGANEPSIASGLAATPLSALMYQSDFGGGDVLQKRLNADGSFRIRGLRPGKLRVAVGNPLAAKGLTLRRVERNGVEQRDGIDIAPEEQVTGVRIVLAYRAADAARP
ncbi:MAG TPA: hypothetical protein VGV59_18270 [Pyrinomonadaceae bacterium]|nr:hypothetical protein [Pyrinomonadaceae bacterium]